MDEQIETTDQSKIPKHIVLTTHNISFKFKRTSGIQPKSQNKHQMKNWTGYIFNNNGYKITTTPKFIIISINRTITAGTVDELIQQYTQIAHKHVKKFAKEHNITIGTIQRHRQPHFSIGSD